MIGTPSTKVSIKIESDVFEANGKGNLIYFRPSNILLKISRFYFSMLKSICSVNVLFIESSLMGISKEYEISEKTFEKKNNKLMSLLMCLSTPGCLTFTATFFP